MIREMKIRTGHSQIISKKVPAGVDCGSQCEGKVRRGSNITERVFSFWLIKSVDSLKKRLAGPETRRVLLSCPFSQYRSQATSLRSDIEEEN